jgi:cation diffusion facilitator family transporter
MKKENGPTPAILERWGWASIGVNVILTALNLAIAYASGSLAVAAEMVHNLVDLVASIAVLVGLKLSIRRSRDFPYGLYKIENVVAVAIALLIFLASYEIAREALLSKARETVVTPWILAGVALSLFIPFAFSFLEMRAGRRANSPSLVADAKEYRVHVLTSGMVFCALIAHTMHQPVDKIAALVIVLVVAKTGWNLLSDSMRVLLDASLDSATLAEAREIIEREATVVRIHTLIGRNAGRYRFLEADVEVKVRELEQADMVARRLERTLRENIPHVERAVVEVRPVKREMLRLALPLEKPDGPLSQHFGTSSVFLLVDKSRADGQIVGQNAVANPFSGDPKGRGIKVAHWLVAQEVDVLLTRDDVRDKGPGHALGEAGVDVIVIRTTSVEEAIEQGWASLSQGLTVVTTPDVVLG